MKQQLRFSPRTSLHRVLDDLGGTLLELVHGDADRPGEIGGVVIYDPIDEPPLPTGALVLGVGLRESDALALTAELARHHATGLVLRAPVTVTDELATAADAAGIALLALTRGATWAQLAALLRSVLAEGDVDAAETETLGGLPAGDLFTLANAISALLDAPITIEDRSSRVLAFSGRQHEADPSRVETILGRQVPEKYAKMLTDRGVFSALYRSSEPLVIEPLPMGGGEFTVPRVAIAVRAGDEILGSIWAAVRDSLSAERSQALMDAAKLVALHLLRIRAGTDVQRRLRADLVATALGGDTAAGKALARLGLADQPVGVIALAIAEVTDLQAMTSATSHGETALLTAERERLADALDLHLSAVHPRSAAALVGDIAYGLIPVPETGDAGTARATRLAREFLGRIGRRTAVVAGIGGVATDPIALADARANADRVVRVLRSGKGAARSAAAQVATLADVQVDSLLLELRDIVVARDERLTGPIAALADYDAVHHTRLLDTLSAYLDALGDVSAAATAIFVHPNTFRYRLRRLAEISGIDLADADARFGAMVQLRVLRSAAGASGEPARPS